MPDAGNPRSYHSSIKPTTRRCIQFRVQMVFWLLSAAMANTLHRYLPELVRYINLNQLCPYLVSERLITLAVCKELLQPHQTSRQYCIVSLVDAMESTGPACYQRFRRALERSMNEESDVHLGHEHLLENVLPRLSSDDDPEDALLSFTDSGIACDSCSCRHTPSHANYSSSRNSTER